MLTGLLFEVATDICEHRVDDLRSSVVTIGHDQAQAPIVRVG